jgi:hypothetical protein
MLAAGTLFSVGCVSGPAVAERQIRESYASVRAAEEVGAERVPQASLYIELAREQLAEARSLIERGRTERATRMLERAGSDADLALALARAHAARRNAQIAQQRIVDARRRLLGSEPQLQLETPQRSAPGQSETDGAGQDAQP